ncbi:hypothetical protein [Halopiger goleimassiliensis]|uniref:hypothetical protein n=1 Tax=Halopiger goleimassiliensis TaxID=1293048 RepID=UPI0006777F61|nr:hypothetical protein [Halopiger goleimassiliensis]
MPDCDYCDASFADEDAYLSHVGSEHADELGRIDRRRAAEHGSLEDDDPPAPIMAYLFVALVAFFMVAMVAYVIVVGV